jgi:amidase
MGNQTDAWEVRAAAKRASILGKIPEAWRLSPADLDTAKSQRDLTEPFIQQFLQPDEISIVSKDSVEIVSEIKEGRLSAVQVTTAFCRTAAVAHQIVWSPPRVIPLNTLSMSY